MRYKVVENIIKDNQKIYDEDLYALMMEAFGIRDRTVALYLKTLQILKKIKIENKELIWIG